MDWYESSIACLDMAEQHVNHISALSKESVNNTKLKKIMSVYIKNCLENCRSPLDYAAVNVFNSFCASEYPKNKKTYFPIRSRESEFVKCMNDNFKNLENKNVSIYELFKECQLFSGNNWLQNLTLLINKNKHIELTAPPVNQITHVHSSPFASNITFVTPEGATPFSINGQRVDFVTPSPYDHLFNVHVEHEYYFKELNLPVVETLNNIQKNVLVIVNKLHLILNN